MGGYQCGKGGYGETSCFHELSDGQVVEVFQFKAESADRPAAFMGELLNAWEGDN